MFSFGLCVGFEERGTESLQLVRTIRYILSIEKDILKSVIKICDKKRGLVHE